MTSKPPRERSQFFVAHLVMVHGMLLVGLLMLVLLAGPKFRGVYKSFGTELPALTKLVLDASEAAGRYILFVLPGIAAVMVADAVFIWSLERNAPPIWSFLWGIAITGILVVSLFLVLFSLFAPFIVIGSSIGTSR